MLFSLPISITLPLSGNWPSYKDVTKVDDPCKEGCLSCTSKFSLTSIHRTLRVMLCLMQDSVVVETEEDPVTCIYVHCRKSIKVTDSRHPMKDVRIQAKRECSVRMPVALNTPPNPNPNQRMNVHANAATSFNRDQCAEHFPLHTN